MKPNYPTSFSLAILCYNESITIERVIRESIQLLSALFSQYELLIIDDGSTDDSRKKIEKIAFDSPEVKCIFHQKNQGIGATLKTAYDNAIYDYVGVIPGDRQFDVTLLKNIIEWSPNQIISFYRKRHVYYSVFRKFISLSNQILNQYLLGFKSKMSIGLRYITEMLWLKFPSK